VEVVAEGPRDAVLLLEAFCRRGPPAARVDAVEVAWEPATGEAGRFAVTR